MIESLEQETRYQNGSSKVKNAILSPSSGDKSDLGHQIHTQTGRLETSVVIVPSE